MDTCTHTTKRHEAFPLRNCHWLEKPLCVVRNIIVIFVQICADLCSIIGCFIKTNYAQFHLQICGLRSHHVSLGNRAVIITQLLISLSYTFMHTVTTQKPQLDIMWPLLVLLCVLSRLQPPQACSQCGHHAPVLQSPRHRQSQPQTLRGLVLISPGFALLLQSHLLQPLHAP